MAHVECYLKIEKARFGDRLNVIYNTQCTSFDIPPLTIQPLVENAVKHGVTKKASGGTIRISTYTEDKKYVIEIIDDGVGFDSDTPMDFNAHEHLGLQNVKTRVADKCKGKLTVKSTVGVGTRVTIEIPIRKGRKK